MRNKRFLNGGHMRPRLTTPVPMTPPAPGAGYGFVAGLVYTAPAEAAVIRFNLSKAWQRLCGYAYPVKKQFAVIEPPPFFSPDGVSVAGIGIQQGTFIFQPSTDDYGDFVTSSGVTQ